MKKNNKENRFDIDFFEFSFLVEACIPPRPIARAMFWQDVIDKHYHVLSDDERSKLFEWINRNIFFQEQIEKENTDCLLFNARYNPDNQYIVTTKYDDKEEKHECFKYNNEYYKKINTSINEDYITNIERR